MATMSQLDDDTLNTIAHQMLADYDAVDPGKIFANGLRLGIPDAWRVQTAVTHLREQRGESVVGYKIGCVCDSNQKAMGLSHPVWGRLWSNEQHADDAVLGKAAFANVALEAEFAVTLSSAISPGHTSTEEITSAIEAVYPVIEIHNKVMRGESPNGHELIANNAIHAGVVRGQPVSDPAALLTTDLALVFDGDIVDSWDSVQWPGDILSAIKWLVETLAESSQRLKAGDLILTGAFGPPIPLGDKTRVDVTSSAFGNVGATFV
jgi:2-keto-4-pentenoate hydratase